MIASLPMYDTAATRAPNDRFWALIRDALGNAPAQLDRNTDSWDVWRAPDLVLSQTCGLPYRLRLHGTVTLVGTPDYGVPGCPPGFYRSVLVVRQHDRRARVSDFAQARLARNDALSQSGWAAFVAHLAEAQGGKPFEGHIIDTGSHAASAQAVLDRQADIAAIDAVTWALLQGENKQLRGLRVLARTRPTPGLPFITAKSQDPDRLRHAIGHAIASLDRQDRCCLMLRGLVNIPAESYLAEAVPAELTVSAP